MSCIHIFSSLFLLIHFLMFALHLIIPILTDILSQDESDLAFDSRALKLLPNVPFEDEADTGDVLAAAEAAMSSSLDTSSSKVTAVALSKL